MSAYRAALDHTTRTIDIRATYFRNLVVAVVSLGLGAIFWALITWTLSPLVGVFLLLPICGVFFFLDNRLLNDWRSQLFEGWARGELDFRSFRAAVEAIPTLPKDTLQSMLATLPSAGDLSTEQGISPTTREAIAAVVTAIHACRSDAIALKAAGYTIIGGSLAVAVTLGIWQPLWGMAVIMSFPPLQRRVRLWRLKCAWRRASAVRRQPDFDRKKCMELAGCLSWDPISASEKGRFLDSWSQDERTTAVSH